MAQHLIIALTVHNDGSISARDWHLSKAHMEAVVDPLGEPTFVTHMPAADRKRLAPVVRDASVVVDNRRQP